MKQLTAAKSPGVGDERPNKHKPFKFGTSLQTGNGLEGLMSIIFIVNAYKLQYLKERGCNK